MAAPVASGPRKTRLAAPIEASYEAVGSTPVQPPGAAAPGSGAPRPGAATPTRVQASPAIIKGSNRTFYQLLGLAFLLIACAYVGYHYWSAPPAPETRRAEGLEPAYGDLASSGEATPGSGAQGLGASGSVAQGSVAQGSVAQGSVAQGSGAVGYSQGQPGDEYQAQSAAGAGGQQAALSEGQAQAGTFGAASGAGVDLRGTAASGSVDRRAEALGTVPLSGEAGPSRSADPAATRRPSRQPIDPRAPRIVTPPPAAPLAVESRPPAKVTLPSARPREPVPVEPVAPKDPPAGAGQAPPQQGGPQQGGKVLLPGTQAWRVPSKKSAPADLPTQTAAASPPPRLEPRPVAPPPQVRTEGIIYWTGKLKKNQTIVIDGAEATVGFADGNLLPGSAVEVHIPSPAVQLVEYPTPRDGWKRVAFRCLRSTKRSVTLNIQWKLR